MIYHSREELLIKAREAIGVPFGQIDTTGRLETGKGAIGTVMEESFFYSGVNNISEPDFKDLGVELKVTPFIRTSKSIRAKERLVCNIIDYMTEYEKTFEESSFWNKCSTMLLMFYEHLYNQLKSEMCIEEVALFSFPEEDLLIIKEDWNKIITKIKEGKAHELSESDTLYLGACTKGANSSTSRPQPFSDFDAKQRAFSLKTSYMTYVLNSFIFGKEKSENIIKSPTELYTSTFEKYVEAKLANYYGISQKQLKIEFDISTTAKNINELILSKMLGIDGKVSRSSEFRKANIVPKTIRIRKDGAIVESMSFPTFKFRQLAEEEWCDSDLKTYFDETKFLFIIFKEDEEGNLVFSKAMFWNIPNQDLDEVRKVWERTKEIAKKGVEIEFRNGIKINNLPKMKENDVCHVRPHARNAEDVDFLPNGQTITKQCFWLNNKYIESVVDSRNL